jgi:hypothetical protein
MKAAVQVEAQMLPNGDIRPLAFHWEGGKVIVASLGRCWDEAGERHFLVMTPDERVYELAYLPEQSSWWLVRRPQDFRPPRNYA